MLISFVLYWARWPLTGKVIWLVCYLLTMALISYIGTKSFGGLGVLSYTESVIAVIVMASAYYAWGLSSGRKIHR